MNNSTFHFNSNYFNDLSVIHLRGSPRVQLRVKDHITAESPRCDCRTTHFYKICLDKLTSN